MIRGLILSLAGLAAMALGLVPTAALGAGVIPTHRLSAAMASEAVQGAIAECAKLGFAVSATVLDADGVTQVLVRGDGAGVHTLKAAHDKAFTAVTFRSPTSALVARVKAGNGPAAIIAKEPNLVLDEGGEPITIGKEVVGAIGVSGSKGKDQDCGKAGIALIRSQLH